MLVQIQCLHFSSTNAPCFIISHNIYYCKRAMCTGTTKGHKTPRPRKAYALVSILRSRKSNVILIFWQFAIKYPFYFIWSCSNIAIKSRPQFNTWYSGLSMLVVLDMMESWICSPSCWLTIGDILMETILTSEFFFIEGYEYYCDKPNHTKFLILIMYYTFKLSDHAGLVNIFAFQMFRAPKTDWQLLACK